MNNSEFGVFIEKYRIALLDLLEIIPKGSRGFVPDAVRNPGIIVGVGDLTGRYALDFYSRERYAELTINGLKVQPRGGDKPGVVISLTEPKLETVLFPGTAVDSLPIHRHRGYVSLVGLTYASKEFKEHDQTGEFHAQFSVAAPGHDWAFEVLPDGCILARDVVHGYIVDGEPRVRVMEWTKIFGCEDMIPKSDAEIRQLAITDFHSAALLFTEDEASAWDFAALLKSMEGPIDSNVLLLGSYSDETRDRFDAAKAAVGKLGYRTFLLKDAPDLPIQTNREKLMLAYMLSCFVIVIDDKPSGHQAELGEMLKLKWRPVIVLRKENRPSSWFLEDEVELSNAFRVEIKGEIDAESLADSVTWARGWVEGQEINLKKSHPWSNEEASPATDPTV